MSSFRPCSSVIGGGRAVRFLVALSLLASSLVAGNEETVSFGRFGPVALYYGPRPPAHVVLFVSGDGGWNLGVVDMARALAGLDALVVGVDITHYLRELAASKDPCLYPAADFEALSKFVQKKVGVPDYIRPVLVGYSSGATLVYATLVQAPPTEFKGGISLGFCPDLRLPKAPCRGSGLEWTMGKPPQTYVFLPCATLEAPWIALQGLIDQVCAPASTEAFVRRTGKASIVNLPHVGHGFGVQKNWLPQFKDAFREITSAPPVENAVVVESLEDLPLVEVKASGAERDILAVLITGDGGWAVPDRGLANELAANGIPVVGLNSLRYFWTKKTAEGAAADLTRILKRYLAVWGKKRVVLIGYSLGADVLPFMLNRIPSDLQAAVRTVVLMGPSETVEFEFHLLDWVGRAAGKDALPVIPEIKKMKPDIPVLCIYGERDDAQICGRLDPARTRSIAIPTGHRFGGNYAPVAAAVLHELNR